MKTFNSYLKNTKKDQILIGILVIFHCVGIIGLNTSFRSSILPLSAMNLCLSFAVLILGRKTNVNRFLLFAGFAFSWGMILELIGVHTHLLFGTYTYGNSLGWKVAGVPLVIGINWAVLCSVCQELISKLKFNIWATTVIGALLMTMLDFLIEPVAVVSDYWSWQNNTIPVYNYVCWFLGALPLHYLYQKMLLTEQNNVAQSLFTILAVFFIILNIV